MIWNELKNYVRDCFCKTPEEVAQAIEEFRKSLTCDKLKNYINSLKEVRSNFIKLKYKKLLI